MTRYVLLLGCAMCVLASGCGSDPGAVERASHQKSPKDSSPDEPPPQSEPPLEDEMEKPAASESKELKLTESGITFAVPEGWKQVKPETNIIEAEFELPRTDDDEYDGRLTMMSSLGDRDEVIATRTAEFKAEPGESPSRETLSIAGLEATLVDLRGEWKGPVFRPISPPREGYRMLFVVIPFGERSSFYAKLTGPRATVAAHEDAFREFLKSAKISR